MESFFKELLDSFLDEDFLEEVRKQYHYEETRMPELRAVAEEMLPLMRREACWERRVKGALWEEVVMTLGEGLDSLQERYAQAGLLSESYMAEVLASELLLRGYAAYNRYVEEKTGYHVARYHFPGSEKDFPLEQLPELLEGFEVPVVCNEVFCLLPGKSVVFIAELTLDQGVRCRGICVGCDSRSCPNRLEEDSRLKRLYSNAADLPLHYGYRRILGGRSHSVSK